MELCDFCYKRMAKDEQYKLVEGMPIMGEERKLYASCLTCYEKACLVEDYVEPIPAPINNRFEILDL